MSYIINAPQQILISGENLRLHSFCERQLTRRSTVGLLLRVVKQGRNCNETCKNKLRHVKFYMSWCNFLFFYIVVRNLTLTLWCHYLNTTVVVQ